MIIASANFGEQIGFMYGYGQFSDFSSEWYMETGTIIITTMFYNALMPFFDFVSHYVYKYVNYFYWGCRRYK